MYVTRRWERSWRMTGDKVKTAGGTMSADLTRTFGHSADASPLPEYVRVIVAYSPDPALVGLPRVLGEEAVLIGRQGPGLALADPRVSRAHASLEMREEGPFLRDLGSRNGTFLNGERVEGAPLTDQDVIRVG